MTDTANATETALFAEVEEVVNASRLLSSSIRARLIDLLHDIEEGDDG
jgi:hypothetical protein